MKFTDVLSILRSLCTDPDKVESRFKQWQRCGFIPGTKMGRGIKCDYNEAMVWRICMLNELQQLGVPPQRANDLIRGITPESGSLLFPAQIFGVENSNTHIAIDLNRIAKAIEAGTAETQSGSVHESAGRQASPGEPE